jgi:D-sedoheptulose 7-phosphate isomerase
MSPLFTRNIHEHLELIAKLSTLSAVVDDAAAQAAATLRSGGKLMLCGNGGSAADSQHIAAELTGRFINDRRPLAAMALSTDSSALTCIGNDYSFDDVFQGQIFGLGKAGDCLIGISTSGNSENVVRAVNAARSLGMATVGLLGRDGDGWQPYAA